MYFFINEIIYHGYKKPAEENKFAFCTCGTKFSLQKRPDGEFDTSVVCPHCGEPYGNLMLRNQKYDRESYGIGREAKKPLFRLEVNGDTVSLIKETAKKDWLTLADDQAPIEVTKTAIHFDVAHGLRPVRLEVNGKVRNLTLSGLQQAGSGLNASNFQPESKTEQFISEMEWIQRTVDGTSSFGIAIKALYKFPVLDSLYEELQRRGIEKSLPFFAIAVKYNWVKEGERNIKKAFGLPKRIIELLYQGKLQIDVAKAVLDKYGIDLGQEVLVLACGIVKGRENILSLSHFLAQRTTAERKRLKAYLTEEVCIYQGIEKPNTAWELLKDYIHLCEEMHVDYELCPKSLKLRHDLAARNHTLVLEEIEREKFKAKVSEPGYANLAWTSKDGQWAVLVPADAGDLVREGAELSHCVGSYASYVIDGSKKICFLRKTENLNKPLLTLTVNAENHCSTYLGFDNRPAKRNEIAALREWTKARGLTLDEYGDD